MPLDTAHGCHFCRHLACPLQQHWVPMCPAVDVEGWWRHACSRELLSHRVDARRWGMSLSIVQLAPLGTVGHASLFSRLQLGIGSSRGVLLSRGWRALARLAHASQGCVPVFLWLECDWHQDARNMNTHVVDLCWVTGFDTEDVANRLNGPRRDEAEWHTRRRESASWSGRRGAAAWS